MIERPRRSRASRSPGAPRVTAIGGGTGLAALLRGLKRHLGDAGLDHLQAVVTVADDGGSSGRLRRDFGVPAPGDIRNCLAALADDEDLLTRLFQFRFAAGEGLTGHSFGNLLLAALTEMTGDFSRAILTAERILSVRGRILPATVANLALRGHATSGKVYEGESAVGRADERLERLELVPADPPAFPLAVRAVREADLVLVGPGSLFTSILPNLLIAEIRAALRARRGRSVLVLNLMTQPGETLGLSGEEHLAVLERHVGAGLLDAVLVHDEPLPAERLEPYRLEGAVPVRLDPAAAARHGVEVVAADLLADTGLIRHDPDKLARAALAIRHRVPVPA
jgi:uncharacterized cofD-like protein